MKFFLVLQVIKTLDPKQNQGSQPEVTELSLHFALEKLWSVLSRFAVLSLKIAKK